MSLDSYPDFMQTVHDVFITYLSQDQYNNEAKMCEINCSNLEPKIKFAIKKNKNDNKIKLSDIPSFSVKLDKQCVELIKQVGEKWKSYNVQKAQEQYILYTFRIIATVIYQFMEVIDTNKINDDFMEKIDNLKQVLKIWKYTNKKYRLYFYNLIHPVYDFLTQKASWLSNKKFEELYNIACFEAVEALDNQIMGNNYNIMVYYFLLSIIEPKINELCNSIKDDSIIDSIKDINIYFNSLIKASSISDLIQINAVLIEQIFESEGVFINSLEILSHADNDKEIGGEQLICNEMINLITDTIINYGKINIILVKKMNENQAIPTNYIINMLSWIIDWTSPLNIDQRAHNQSSGLFDFNQNVERFQPIKTFTSFQLSEISPLEFIDVDLTSKVNEFISLICQLLEFRQHELTAFIDSMITMAKKLKKNPQIISMFKPESTALSARLAYCALFILNTMSKDSIEKTNVILCKFASSKYFGDGLLEWNIDNEYMSLVYKLYNNLFFLIARSLASNNIGLTIQTISKIANKESPLYAYQMVSASYALWQQNEDLKAQIIPRLAAGNGVISAMITSNSKFRSIHGRFEGLNKRSIEDIRISIISFIIYALDYSSSLYNISLIPGMLFDMLFEESLNDLALSKIEYGYKSSEMNFKIAIYNFITELINAITDPSQQEYVEEVIIKLLHIFKKYPKNNFDGFFNANFFEAFGNMILRVSTNGSIDMTTDNLIVEGIKLTTALLFGIASNVKALTSVNFYQRIEEAISKIEISEKLSCSLISHIFGSDITLETASMPISNIEAAPYITRLIQKTPYFSNYLDILFMCCKNSFSNCAKLSNCGIPALLLEIYCENMDTVETLTEIQEKAGNLFVEIIQRTVDQDTLKLLIKKMYKIERREENKDATFFRICNSRHPFYLLKRAGEAVTLESIPSLFLFSSDDSCLNITKLVTIDVLEFTFSICFMADVMQTEDDENETRRSLLYVSGDNGFFSLEIGINGVFIRTDQDERKFVNSSIIRNDQFTTLVASFNNYSVSCLIKCCDKMESYTVETKIPALHGKIMASVGKLMNGPASGLALNVASINWFSNFMFEDVRKEIVNTPPSAHISNPFPDISVSPAYEIDKNFCQNIGKEERFLSFIGERFPFCRSLFQMMRYIAGPCTYLILIQQLLQETSCGSEDQLESKKVFFSGILNFYQNVVFKSKDLRHAFLEEDGFTLMNHSFRNVKTEKIFDNIFICQLLGIWDVIIRYPNSEDEGNETKKLLLSMIREIWMSKRIIEIVDEDIKSYFLDQARSHFVEFYNKFGESLEPSEIDDIPMVWPIMTIIQKINDFDKGPGYSENEEKLQNYVNDIISFVQQISNVIFKEEDHENIVARILYHLRINQIIAIHTPSEFIKLLNNLYQKETIINYINNETIQELAWTFHYIGNYAYNNPQFKEDYLTSIFNCMNQIANKSFSFAQTFAITAAVAFKTKFHGITAHELDSLEKEVVDKSKELLINGSNNNENLIGAMLPIFIHMELFKAKGDEEDPEAADMVQWVASIASQEKNIASLIRNQWWSFWILLLIISFNIFNNCIKSLITILLYEADNKPENSRRSCAMIEKMLYLAQNDGRCNSHIQIAIEMIEMINQNSSPAHIEIFLHFAFDGLFLASSCDTKLGNSSHNALNTILFFKMGETPSDFPMASDEIPISNLIALHKKILEVSQNKNTNKLVAYCLAFYLMESQDDEFETLIKLLSDLGKEGRIGIRAGMEKTGKVDNACKFDDDIAQIPDLANNIRRTLGTFQNIAKMSNTLPDINNIVKDILTKSFIRIKEEVRIFSDSEEYIKFNSADDLMKDIHTYAQNCIENSEREFIEQYHIGRKIYKNFIIKQAAFGGVWALNEGIRWIMKTRLDSFFRTTYLIQDTCYNNHKDITNGPVWWMIGAAREQNDLLSAKTLSRDPTVYIPIDSNIHIGNSNCKLGHYNEMLDANLIITENGIDILFKPDEAEIVSILWPNISMVLRRDIPRFPSPDNEKSKKNIRAVYDQGVEIFILNGNSYFIWLNCPDQMSYDNIADVVAINNKSALIQRDPTPQFFKSLGFTERWIKGEMTNYEYIMCLNIFGGRTFQYWARYPVFPIIFNNYENRDPRDLAWPYDRQSEEDRKRADQYAKEDSTFKSKQFFIMSEYQVLYLHAFIEPVTTIHIKFQSNKPEPAGRYFRDISVFPTNNSPGELTPQMFTLPQIIKNVNDYHPQPGIGDAVLPSWAKSPLDFIRKHFAALESPEVSRSIHHWIDLVFGYKLTEKECDAAYNRYTQYVYTGENETGELQALGVCLPPIFTSEHPQRKLCDPRLDKVGVPIVVPLNSTPTQLSVNSRGCVILNEREEVLIFKVDSKKPQKTCILNGKGHFVTADINQNILYEWAAPTKSLRSIQFKLFRSQESFGEPEEFSPVISLFNLEKSLLLLHSDCAIELVRKESLSKVWRKMYNRPPAVSFGFSERSNIVASVNASGSVVLCSLVDGEFITQFYSHIKPRSIHVADDLFVAVVGEDSVAIYAYDGELEVIAHAEKNIISSCVVEIGGIHSLLALAYEDEIVIADLTENLKSIPATDEIDFSAEYITKIEDRKLFSVQMESKPLSVGYDQTSKRIVVTTGQSVCFIPLIIVHDSTN